MTTELLFRIAVLMLIMVAYRFTKIGVKSWWKGRQARRKSPHVKP